MNIVVNGGAVAASVAYLWRRACRPLLLHYPLVWRSSLPLVALLAGPTALLAAWVAKVQNVAPDTMHPALQLDAVSTMLLILTGLGWFLWARLLMPYPADHAPWRSRCVALACNGICLLLLTMPALVYEQVLSERVAQAIPVEELAQHIVLLSSVNFGECSEDTKADLEGDRLEVIQSSLSRFGLQTSGRTSDAFCNGKWREVLLLDKAGVRTRNQLREVVSIISRAQQRSEAAKGLGFATALMRMRELAFQLFFVISVALMAVLLARRQQRPSGPQTDRVILMLDGVGSSRGLRRLDRYLMLNRPGLWSAQLHVFMVQAILLTFVVLGAGMLFEKFPWDVYLVFASAAFTAVYGLAWWMFLGHVRATPSDTVYQLLLRSILIYIGIGCFGTVVAAVSLSARSHVGDFEVIEENAASLIIWWLLGAQVSVMAVVANFVGRITTLVVNVAGMYLALTLALFFFAFHSKGSLLIVPAWLALVAVLAVVHRITGSWAVAPVRLLASLLLAMLPVIVSLQASTIYDTIISVAGLEKTAQWLMTPIFIALFLVLLAGPGVVPLRVLSRARCLPSHV